MLNPLLAHYPKQADCYDEMLDDANQVRPHWRTMMDSFSGETPEMMAKRIDMVQRLVQENGVTYNVYDDENGSKRPWDLNFLPLILPEHEWAEIEAGVIQRASLLNSILLDVYGEQQIIQEGILPPALIYSHGGFLRPCHGKHHLDNVALHFYAVDLARAPNGRWWVVGDRTQAPSGAGYALENRAVMGRVFPDLLRTLKVRHLTDFFSTMLDSLTRWGRLCAAQSGMPLRASEPPLIVLLTPGTFNETYFEQAYLARHLGVPLVEGNDLTVRNGMVWFKSLSGLRRVHVIMRRVDDDYCDPLELKANSTLGVAGLTLAAQLGNVLIANSLGSSLLESGALLGYLPQLCQRFLGQDLALPSVATWWCGEPAALDSVLNRLDELVIKPSFPQLRHFPVFGQDLNLQQRQQLIEKIKQNPNNYVAQELVKLSQAPIWQPSSFQQVHATDQSTLSHSLSSSKIGLRVYACATPNGYIVLPGGLTRAATGADTRIITMQRGGGSKDTWILSGTDKHNIHTDLARTITSKELVREDTQISSRMAENQFWFGRNIDRCDNLARLLRMSLKFLANVAPLERGSEWLAIQRICADYDLFDQQTNQHNNDSQIEAALVQAVINADVAGLARQLTFLHQSANQLSERFSIDNWRVLNQMLPKKVMLKNEAFSHLNQAKALGMLDEVTTSLMTLTGFTLDGMTRDLGWNFLSLGRKLERLQFQSSALQSALAMDGNGSLDWLLELSDSIVTYRARYRSQPEWLPCLDLLILDESNPRSVLFQIDGIRKNLKKITRAYGAIDDEPLEQCRLQLLALDEDVDLFCGNPKLSTLLAQIWQVSAQLSEQISQQFFSYTGQQSHVGIRL